MKIRVHMPTRSRPERALHVLDTFKRLSTPARRAAVAYSVVVDSDDPTMADHQVRARLARLGATVTVGGHRSKVEACNAGIDRDFDVLLLASDDMTPVTRDWDQVLLAAMVEHFPNFDGALHFNDGHVGEKLCTFPIMGVNLYKKFGYVYAPCYASLWCDNEYTDLLRSMNRLPYFPKVLFRHDHFSFGGRPRDALYDRNEALRADDEVPFRARESMKRPGSQFAFDSPPIRLSILIASVRSRTEQLRKLLADLNGEINSCNVVREVEIVVARDDGKIPIGQKRQQLLERSVGTHVAFVDDDDAVAPDYCRQIIAGLRDKPEADCMSLEGQITTDGRDPRTFRHSFGFDGWYEKDGVYFRTPNHLNVVRRDHALAAGFGTERFGEDRLYSDRLTARLKALGRPVVELPTSGVIYHYRYSSRKSA